jgi:hypothetical protein
LQARDAGVVQVRAAEPVEHPRRRPRRAGGGDRDERRELALA